MMTCERRRFLFGTTRGSMVNGAQKKDLFMMQVRLFRLAQLRWCLSAKECSRLFRSYRLYAYIENCYDFFHVQGDEANLLDMAAFLATKGVRL